MPALRMAGFENPKIQVSWKIKYVTTVILLNVLTRCHKWTQKMRIMSIYAKYSSQNTEQQTRVRIWLQNCSFKGCSSGRNTRTFHRQGTYERMDSLWLLRFEAVRKGKETFLLIAFACLFTFSFHQRLLSSPSSAKLEQ